VEEAVVETAATGQDVSSVSVGQQPNDAPQPNALCGPSATRGNLATQALNDEAPLIVVELSDAQTGGNTPCWTIFWNSRR